MTRNKQIFQIRITLNRTKPPIWRRVAVPSDITLGQLHEVIQIVMGWMDCHLHQFTLRDKSLIRKNPDVITRMMEGGGNWWNKLFTATRGIRVFVPRTTPFGDEMDMEGEDENTVTLGQLCPKVKRKLIYEYDFGDGWEHTVEVQKIVEPEPGVEYPVCLAGKKACPPEDCGGVYGYYEMLEALANPRHAGHEELLEWLGDEFDPDAFDLEEINAILTEWRKGCA